MQHERNFISNFGLAGGGTGSGADVVNIAKKYLGEANGQIANQAQRENITLHKMKEHAFGLTLQRSGDEGAKAQLHHQCSNTMVLNIIKIAMSL